MFDLLLRVFLNKIEKEEDRNPESNPDLSYPNIPLTTTLPQRPAKIRKN